MSVQVASESVAGDRVVRLNVQVAHSRTCCDWSLANRKSWSCSTFATKSLVVSSRIEKVAPLNMQSLSHCLLL